MEARFVAGEREGSMVVAAASKATAANAEIIKRFMGTSIPPATGDVCEIGGEIQPRDAGPSRPLYFLGASERVLPSAL